MTDRSTDTDHEDDRLFSASATWQRASDYLNRLFSNRRQWKFTIWPRVSDEPRRLLRLVRSENIRAKKLGIKTLAELNWLPAWLCVELAQCCYDVGILSSLALHGSNIPEYINRFSPKYDGIEESNRTVESELRSLLDLLRPSTKDVCVDLITDLALKNTGRVATTEEEEVLWSDPDSEYEHPIGFGFSARIRKLLIYMEALGLQSTLPYQRDRIADPRTFRLLHEIWDVARDIDSGDYRLPILILKVLSNMALSLTNSQHFLYSGWIAKLAKCRKMEKIELRLLAEKCLTNLCNQSKAVDDAEWGVLYDDGVYVLHDVPDKKPTADIIFVHGLRGGVFYSWRQKDLAKPNLNKKRAKNNEIQLPTSDSYTYCWPKDWLYEDLGASVRILGVDYASFVTDWRQRCPEFHERNTIIARARDLLEKLNKAGVGERPIIWVCHSMGGLLVKELLCSLRQRNKVDDRPDAEDLWSKFVEKTIGVAFYSVPHYGSPVASRSVESSYRYFLLPSIEVTELRESSKYLQLLQDSFIDLVRAQKIESISFSETIPTTFPMRIKTLVVPHKSSYIDLGSHYFLNEPHKNTCKPLDRSSVNYRILVDFLNRLLT